MNTDVIKLKLKSSNLGSLCKYLAPREIEASKNQTLAEAIKPKYIKFAVEKRLYWAEVAEGHDGEVAVNPFSILCRWLKPETSVIMEGNEEVNYNAKKI